MTGSRPAPARRPPGRSRSVRRRRDAVLAAVVATAVVGAGLVTGILPSPAGGASADPASCTVDALTGGWSTGTLHLSAAEVDGDAGRALLDVRGDVPAATASTMKVLTAAAAVEGLGPDRRIATRVVQGARADTVVLVGGGDPTLSRLPSGTDGVYPDAPHLDDLARQVLDARRADPDLAGVPIRRLQVDSGLFTGPAWLPEWPLEARRGGSMSNITALTVDGDRDDPAEAYSRRGEKAVARAADAFAALLGDDVAADGPLVTAAPGSAVLGTVESAPVRDLVGYMLTHSDDTLAETLARLVAIETGAGSAAADIRSGTPAALADLDLPTDGVVLVDGSGLSDANRVPAALLTRLMVRVAEHRGDLAIVDAGLAVAGRTGTLAEGGRFTGAADAAAGRIRGKTGTLERMHGLTGIADAADGTEVAFTIWAEDVDPSVPAESARAEIDALATDLHRCGGALGG
ncbi:D-alanyl-D-alanine carboxypeptidase/D-alanyl-D-alanine-endopeptidase [Clavibacter michiganensis]|uniref:D-alanyl-D-alanine carboxypeptidase/D-alanyl-D-alanine-endopeptidase n=1 Tax=Clavibacter michiganensis TaxID=28447 RepID=UPI000A3B6654|nr:D-alanyl-D-alanine carboxypeptidase [Clavibacter michiganensis]MDO4127123.1 D-alanyl-D-alanine carboxypeptidase [Clavibacter michiganensis]NIY60961.1 D-alanyl-D-alanine carboxypeptidase [Clavibacter michiganensis subsp. michiganensis]OUE20168.1 D-alanyl-D-alanine carboxypeptidase DacB precursor [Clavibacter michiganensis subsp. michiganensis]QXP01994.1 D-alanyl-D-alanine carboxypeptidase [Clavibacter michiganensis subsp. michiganensis]QXP05020.1 D-alanyl-D-alanine carboxypeptidase [Clavibac